MSETEMIVAIVAIASGTGIGITIFQGIFKLIGKSIDRKKGNNELNEKFFDDYLAFKNYVLQELEGKKKPELKKANTNNNSLDQSSSEIDFSSAPKLKNMLGEKK